MIQRTDQRSFAPGLQGNLDRGCFGSQFLRAVSFVKPFLETLRKPRRFLETRESSWIPFPIPPDAIGIYFTRGKHHHRRTSVTSSSRSGIIERLHRKYIDVCMLTESILKKYWRNFRVCARWKGKFKVRHRSSIWWRNMLTLTLNFKSGNFSCILLVTKLFQGTIVFSKNQKGFLII